MNVQAPSCAEPKQLFLDMFTPLEIEAWTCEQKKRQQRNEARKRRLEALWIQSNSKKTKAIDEINASLLDQPLGSNPDQELLDLGDPYIGIDDGDVVSQSDEKPESWSEEAVEQLHEGMLLYSLRLLNARGNGKEKKDLLRWIFDPAVMVMADTENEVPFIWKIIQPSEVPFSFELCCRLAGYDAERLREGLVPVLTNLGLDALFKEIDYARQCEQDERAGKCGQEAQAGNVQPTLDLRHSRGAGKSGNRGGAAGDVRSTEKGPALRVRDGALA